MMEGRRRKLLQLSWWFYTEPRSKGRKDAPHTFLLPAPYVPWGIFRCFFLSLSRFFHPVHFSTLIEAAAEPFAEESSRAVAAAQFPPVTRILGFQMGRRFPPPGKLAGSQKHSQNNPLRPRARSESCSSRSIHNSWRTVRPSSPGAAHLHTRWHRCLYT